MTEGTAHRPTPLLWECAECGNPWPCEPARAHYTVLFARSRAQLAVLMSSYLAVAVMDLLEVPAGELYERFVGWTRYCDRLP